MDNSGKKRTPQAPMNGASTGGNAVENFLNSNVTRRQAIGRGAAVGAGVVVAVVAVAGGYYYYTTTQSSTTSSSSSSSTTTPGSSTTQPSSSTTTTTSCTILSSLCVNSATCSTYTVPASYTSISSSGTPAWQSGSAPSTPIKFDIWAFRPDLVQIGVNRFQQQMHENVSLNVITANYDATVETKLLAGDLDLAYETPDGAQKAFANGLTADLKGVTADFPTGRNMWNVSDELAAIAKGYPSFVDTMTSLQGNLVALPYYQSCFGVPLANNKLLQTAGLATSATDNTNWPNSYTDLYNQMPTIAKSGAASTPLIPLWYEAFPGWGIPHQFLGEAGARFGYNKELFSAKPAFTPMFDTNTGVADMLTDWMNLWTNNYVPHGIITLSSDGDVDGLFESGAFAYALWWQYALKYLNNPTVSKIAGTVNPVPNGTGANGNNWGYTVQQVYLMRNIEDAALAARVHGAATWFTWKDRTEYPYEPLRIAAQADIAAFTAYQDVNLGPEVATAFNTSVPDPSTQISQMVSIQEHSTYNQIIPAPWADDFMIDLSTELPKYLTGAQSQATTITNLKNDAQQLIKSASST